MNFHTKSEVCSSKNGLVMSTLYFCTFYICSLFGQSIRTSMQNLESLAQKVSMLCSIQDSLPFRSSSALWSRLCLKASRQGHLIYHQISPSPDVPQNLFTPQNVAIDQGINLRVVPTSQDSLGRSYCCRSRPQQIFSLYFSPNISKSYLDAQTHILIYRDASYYVWGV